jgi:hypothetical protein
MRGVMHSMARVGYRIAEWSDELEQRRASARQEL